MIGAWSGAYGAPSLAKAEGQLAKMNEKIAAGKRCGFPPSKAACQRKAQKFTDIVNTLRAEQAAMQQVIAQTDPNAAALAVEQAGAANVAQVAALSDSTAYIAGGVVLLGALAAAAFFAFGGK